MTHNCANCDFTIILNSIQYFRKKIEILKLGSVARMRINLKSQTLEGYNFQNNDFRKLFFVPSYSTSLNTYVSQNFQKKDG